jgi:hypothetical protein
VVLFNQKHIEAVHFIGLIIIKGIHLIRAEVAVPPPGTVNLVARHGDLKALQGVPAGQGMARRIGIVLQFKRGLEPQAVYLAVAVGVFGKTVEELVRRVPVDIVVRQVRVTGGPVAGSRLGIIGSTVVLYTHIWIRVHQPT